MKKILFIILIIASTIVLTDSSCQKFDQNNFPKENLLILEYLKVMQDNTSPEKMILPSMEDKVGQTFNNSVVAIAFILKGEKERAERILNFYANATDTTNTDKTLQNFFYKGEARGFYQSMALVQVDNVKPFHTFNYQNDRWIGDIVWLGLACKYYQKKFNNSDKYSPLVNLIKNLLISFFEDKGTYGYVQSGWRKGDTSLHEKTGHHEGNIDCYAFLKLCGEETYAQKIKNWLDNQLYNTKNTSLPLDLYTWGAMSLGKQYGYLLQIPEDSTNFFIKKIQFNGKQITGFYSSPNILADVIWTEGLAHMSCAYSFIGNNFKASFYTYQLENMIFDRNAYNKINMALPYASAKKDGYDWVNTNQGFSSTCAWYILACNRFNPFTLQTY